MRSEMFRQITLAGEDFGNEAAGTTADILVYERDHAGNILLASGLDVPVDTTSGYAKGCIFLDRNVATGISGRYENVGTSTSCNFDVLTATAAEVNLVCDGNTSTAAEINKVCDVSTNTQEITTTAATAVTSAVMNIEFNLSSGVGVTTIADLADHQGLMTIKQIGASTAGASVTATAGTWDGTNNVATTDAAKEALIVHIDSDGNGTIVENVGSVALS